MKTALKPWSSYADLSTIAATVMGILALCLVLTPALIHWLFNIASDAATDVMSRRAGMLFLGLAVIIFQARNAPQSPLRRAISSGIAVLMAGLALLGLFEFWRGHVGPGILLAIGVELFFVVCYTRFLFGQNAQITVE